MNWNISWPCVNYPCRSYKTLLKTILKKSAISTISTQRTIAHTIIILVAQQILSHMQYYRGGLISGLAGAQNPPTWQTKNRQKNIGYSSRSCYNLYNFAYSLLPSHLISNAIGKTRGCFVNAYAHKMQICTILFIEQRRSAYKDILRQVLCCRYEVYQHDT